MVMASHDDYFSFSRTLRADDMTAAE